MEDTVFQLVWMGGVMAALKEMGTLGAAGGFQGLNYIKFRNF